MADFIKKKARKKPDLKELRFQKAATKLLDMTNLKWFHPFNEGKRTGWEQKNFTEIGGKKGLPDIFILDTPLLGLTYKAVVIELKIGNNKLRDSQKLWKNNIESCNIAYIICYTLDEVIEVLKKYYPDFVSHIKF